MDSLDRIDQLCTRSQKQEEIEKGIQNKIQKKSDKLFGNFEEKLSSGIITVYSFLSSACKEGKYFRGDTIFKEKGCNENSEVDISFGGESGFFKEKDLLRVRIYPDWSHLEIIIRMSPEYTRFIKKKTGKYHLDYRSGHGWQEGAWEEGTVYISKRGNMFSILNELKEKGERAYRHLIEHEPEQSKAFEKGINLLKNLPKCLDVIYKKKEKERKKLLEKI